MRKFFALILALLLFALPALGDETEDMVRVTLSDDGITVDGTGAAAEGSVLKITLPGVYELTGSLSNGQVLVCNDMTEKITLVLNGVSIHNENAPAVYIQTSPERVTLSTVGDTENKFSTGESFRDSADGEPDAVIYSTADLTLTGKGILEIVSAGQNGVASKDDLKIKGGTLKVDARRHGIRGKDSVEIYDGDITITAGKDGIRSTNTGRTDRGFVEISGGSIHITCGDDPIQAVTRISVLGGTVDVKLVSEADDD